MGYHFFESNIANAHNFLFRGEKQVVGVVKKMIIQKLVKNCFVKLCDFFVCFAKQLLHDVAQRKHKVAQSLKTGVQKNKKRMIKIFEKNETYSLFVHHVVAFVLLCTI